MSKSKRSNRSLLSTKRLLPFLYKKKLFTNWDALRVYSVRLHRALQQL